jgi:hypothetical protein
MLGLYIGLGITSALLILVIFKLIDLESKLFGVSERQRIDYEYAKTLFSDHADRLHRAESRIGRHDQQFETVDRSLDNDAVRLADLEQATKKRRKGPPHLTLVSTNDDESDKPGTTRFDKF